MTTPTINHERNTFQEHRRSEARAVTTVLALVAAVGFTAAVVPAVENTITTALLTLGVVIAAVVVLRVLARWVRHRREDRADALVAAAWRARHAPHLLTPTGAVTPVETAGAVGDRRAA